MYAAELPDPFPNSEVKRGRADDSLVHASAKVGSCPFILKTPLKGVFFSDGEQSLKGISLTNQFVISIIVYKNQSKRENMLKRLKSWFIRTHQESPDFVSELRSHLGLSHLNDDRFRRYIWDFAFRNHAELDERDVDGFHIFDVPQLSTEKIKVSLVLAKKGAYEEHMHLNSAAYFMIIHGRAKVILNGEKLSTGFDLLSGSSSYSIPKGMYHGFEIASQSMLFISIQSPPILEDGIEDIQFHDRLVTS